MSSEHRGRLCHHDNQHKQLNYTRQLARFGIEEMECQYNNIQFLPLMYVLMILLHMLLTLTCVSDLGQEWHKQRQKQ